MDFLIHDKSTLFLNGIWFVFIFFLISSVRSGQGAAAGLVSHVQTPVFGSWSWNWNVYAQRKVLGEAVPG